VNILQRYPLIAAFSVLAVLSLLLWRRRSQLAFYEIPEDDVEMRQATEQARNTLNSFFQTLALPNEEQTSFGIKVRFKADDVIEHLWIDDPKVEGSEIIGRVGNAPVHLNRIKEGQTVKVEKGAISDWMFVEHGWLQGGFTIRVHYLRQPPRLRTKIAKGLPFKIEELEKWQSDQDQ